MKKIFISYSRKDLDFVKELAEDLQQAGYDVWYDMTDLEGGDHWADELQIAIDESQVYVLVISPNSVASEWVEKEFIYAGSVGKRIVPLMREQITLPLWLVNIHYVDIQGRNYKKNFQDILRALDDEDKSPPVPAPKKGLPRLSPAWIGGIVGVVALILAATFGLPALKGGTESTPDATVTATSPASIPTDTPAPAEETPVSSPTVTEQAATVVAVTPTPEPEITDAKGAEMVLVPVGSFTMGNTDGAMDERPHHTVDLGDYYIDKFEVTNAQYKGCVDANACEFPNTRLFYDNAQYNDHPVVYVNWNMAADYCVWRGARLPTEAEWEKAARGTQSYSYPWGNDFDGKLLNYCDLNCTIGKPDPAYNDGFAMTAPVGSYEGGKSHSFGVYDMAGNALEWVADWYDVYPDGDPDASPNFGQKYKVLRGGSWVGNRDDIRTFKRIGLNPLTAYNYIGFRCARDVNP